MNHNNSLHETTSSLHKTPIMKKSFDLHRIVMLINWDISLKATLTLKSSDSCLAYFVKTLLAMDSKW